MIYRRTPLDEYGDKKLYLEALELPEEFHKEFINQIGWKITWSIRQDPKNEYKRFVIIHKRNLQQGNLWEETLLFEGGKILPDDAYE